MNDPRSFRQLCGPVAVAPHAGEVREVGVVILGAVRVVPEHDRHVGQRLREHELTHLTNHGFALGVERVRINAQHLALEFVDVHRVERVGSQDAGTNVRSTRAGTQLEIVFDLLICPPPRGTGKRGPGGHDVFQVRQRVAFRRVDAGFFDKRQKRGPGADLGDIFTFRNVEQASGRGVGGRAVVRDGGGAQGQHVHHEVPHHPRGGHCEVQAGVFVRPVVQANHLVHVQNDSAVPVHNSFGLTRCARGVQDPQRMGELDWFKYWGLWGGGEFGKAVMGDRGGSARAFLSGEVCVRVWVGVAVTVDEDMVLHRGEHA